MINIDARGYTEEELFRELRDIFTSGAGLNSAVEVLIDSRCDYKKLLTFARMSGCRVETEEKGADRLVRLTDCCPSCG